ncbi:MAG: hypothetical protein BWK73_25475 [Thiothrix lacustris]|uniref:HTH cro/C1-type domain-containing protein n=1 Tax=Thiothrix lacustris TaxID=525917 RepID=A0A1Y1QLB8_9GAMM|nr:MAG: hypothetical protein BWK73_25475 [Thiothrix lacustris]
MHARDFGDTLRKLRTAQNLSQDELAAAMNVTKSSISLWENGTIPRPDKRARLALLLGTSEDHLMGGAAPPESLVGEALVGQEAGGYVLVRPLVDTHSMTTIRVSRRTIAEAQMTGKDMRHHTMQDNSMAPVLPVGTLMVLSLTTNALVNGAPYVIRQGMHTRVALVYGGGLGQLRLRFYNNAEYPDEICNEGDPRYPEIVGKVFWWAVVLR